MELTAIHTNCSGCGVCRQACTLENFREVNPAKALLTVEGRFPSPGDYCIHICDQCGVCADTCPVDAIHLIDGVYRVDEEECTSCMESELLSNLALCGVPAKCILCGKCAELCPRQALIIEGDSMREVG